jgi:D-Tyr-tRNAtyr deacylase
MRTADKARQNVCMRAVVQRVDGASVVVEGQTIGAFEGPGLLVLIGVSVDDDESKCAVLADKIWKLRIFESAALKQLAKQLTLSQLKLQPLMLACRSWLSANSHFLQTPQMVAALLGSKQLVAHKPSR